MELNDYHNLAQRTAQTEMFIPFIEKLKGSNIVMEVPEETTEENEDENDEI
jgi:hypothetical protein